MNDTPGSPKINDLPTEAAAAAERAAWWLLQKDTVGPPSDFTPDVMAAIERRLATIGVEPNHFRGCVALANRLRQGQQPVTGETSRLYTRIYYRLRWSMARPADYLGSGWNDNQKRSENTFGVYRAAFGYGITQALDNCLRSILAIEGDDELLRLEWTHFLTRLGELVDLNPDYEGQRIAESSPSTFKAACPPDMQASVKSKRRGMSKLEDGWIAATVQLARTTRHLAAVLTLALTGARPAELQKGLGVGVVHTGTHLRFRIQGAKLSAHSGQPWRKIDVDLRDPLARELANHLSLSARAQRARVKAGAKALCECMRRIGQRFLEHPKNKSGYKLSCISLRHSFAADQKAAASQQGQGDDRAELAQMLGHAVDRTSQIYGTACAGRPRKFRPRGHAANEVKRTRRNPATFVAAGHRPPLQKPST